MSVAPLWSAVASIQCMYADLAQNGNAEIHFGTSVTDLGECAEQCTLVSSQGSLIKEVLNTRHKCGQAVGTVAEEEVLNAVDVASGSNKAR